MKTFINKVNIIYLQMKKVQMLTKINNVIGKIILSSKKEMAQINRDIRKYFGSKQIYNFQDLEKYN